MTDKPDNTKRLKESDWIIVVALWERGEATLTELSDRFEISKPALSQGLKRRKAVRGSKAHVAQKKIQDKILEEKEKMIEDIYNFKKRYLEYGNYLGDLAIETIREAKKPGGSGLANARGDLSSIAEGVKIFDKVRDNIYHLYGLYDKETTTETDYSFNVGVYTEKDVENMREAQEFIDNYKSAREADPDEDLDNEPEDEDYEGID